MFPHTGRVNKMQKFLSEFEEFCITLGIQSGKARSYAKAIEYLCDYLKITVIDTNAISYLRSIENEVKDKNSSFYNDLLLFLASRGQKSYLSKGWIRSGLNHLLEFVSQR